MIIRLIVLIIWTLSINCVLSQSWYPIDAKWYYNTQLIAAYTVDGYTSYQVNKDTVIMTRDAKEIFFSTHLSNTVDIDRFDTIFILEENSRVFIWNGEDFSLMYDFNLIPGDTLEVLANVGLGCDSVSSITVDSVGVMETTGLPLKIQYISYYEYWPNEIHPVKISDKVIERIGRIQSFIYSPNCAIDATPIENLRLRCYEDNDIAYKSDWWAHSYSEYPCDTIWDNSTNIISFEDKNQITIYPNPCHNIVNLQFPDDQIRRILLYNSIGRLVRVHMTKNDFLQLEIKDLPNGVYLVAIDTGHLSDSRILIKQ